MEIVSIILNAVLGGGILIQFFTMRSVKAKARAEAEGVQAKTNSNEIENVSKAIEIWRNMAEDLNEELQEQREKNNILAINVEKLRKDVVKLTTASNKILKLLDKLTPENMEKTIAEIKEQLK